jgi:hypothetical protein
MDATVARCPHCNQPVTTTPTTPGRADILGVNHRGPDIAVEVKVFRKTKTDDLGERLAFSSITPKQRRWLSLFDADSVIDPETGHAVAASFLAVGTVTGRAGKDRYLWLVPWPEWTIAEQEIHFWLRQKSMVKEPYPGMQKRELVEESELFAIHMLSKWALLWYNGGWTLPDDHPLMWKLERERHSREERDLDEEGRRWRI